MREKIEQKESEKSRKKEKKRKKTKNKKQKKDNIMGMHQQVDFPLSPSKSYPLSKKGKKVFLLRTLTIQV